MPAGRPSDYDPSYCDLVVEKAGEGWSLYEVAHELNVARPTLDNWASAHPEFLNALSRAKTAAQAWWEQTGRSGMREDKFNAAVWKKTMEARFREDYTERRETEISGSLAINHEAALAELK